MLLYVFAFLVVGALDLLWVVYMQTVARGQRAAAGATAAVLFAASGLTTLAYVEDPAVLVAGTLGAFAGTFVAVRKKKETNGPAAEVDVPKRTWTVVSAREAADLFKGSVWPGHGDDRL